MKKKIKVKNQVQKSVIAGLIFRPVDEHFTYHGQHSQSTDIGVLQEFH